MYADGIERAEAIRETKAIAARINSHLERLSHSGLTKQEQQDLVVQALRESGMLPDSVLQ